MIYILLPCFNEYENLNILIKKINNLSLNNNYIFKLIIVNDGSTDQTNSNINKLKKKSKNNIIYINHKKNLGLNMSMFSGFIKFLKVAKKNDIIVTLDSDNTPPISLIPKLIKPIKENKCDIVIASRFQKGSSIKGLSLFRKILSEGARSIFKLMLSIENIEDYTCNFRSYSYSILKKSNLIKKDFFLKKDFSIIADLLINVCKKSSNVKIKEVALKLRYDFKIGKSKLNITKNIFKTLWLVARNVF